jgi:hypothetical protein
MGWLRTLFGLPPKRTAPRFEIELANVLEVKLRDGKDRGKFLARLMVIVPDGAVLDLEDWIPVMGDIGDRHRRRLAQFADKGERPDGISASRHNEVLRVRVDAESRPAINAAIEEADIAGTWQYIRIYTRDRVLLECYDLMIDLFVAADFAGDMVFGLLKEGIVKSISRSD